MAFNLNLSPLTQSQANLGRTLTGIGQNLGEAIAQRGQQQQQQDLNVMINQALSGDEQAMKFVAAQNPELALKIQDRMAQQAQMTQEAEMQEQERFQGERATATADFVERMHLAAPEAQDAMFEDAINNPMLDIDEEDRPFFKDANARKALVSQVKGKDYAENFFAGMDSDAGQGFAPTVSSLQTDPETGQKYVTITDRNTGEVKRMDAPGAIGETLKQEQDRGFRKASLDDARSISKESFGELKNVKSSIGTINEAIKAIDDGAQAGFFDKYLPSFRESTIALENAAQRMGLDVISATTFGALSEGELRLAMDTAMPQNLKPKELRKWLVDRRNAKRKLANELSKMAVILGKGKTTIAEYLEKNSEYADTPEEQPQQMTNEFAGFKVVR